MSEALFDKRPLNPPEIPFPLVSNGYLRSFLVTCVALLCRCAVLSFTFNCAFAQTNPVAVGAPTGKDSQLFSPEMIKVEGGLLPKDSTVERRSVKDFEIGKYEVTWGEWQKVRDWAVANGYDDLNGLGKGLSETHPVTDVIWYDLLKWCNAKSEMERLQPVYLLEGKVYKTGGEPSKTGALAIKEKSGARGYRLPSEAEREWAARGGKKAKRYMYSGGNALDEVAWTVDNSGGQPHPVGQKKPNELGIYDMSGNIMEWCNGPDGTFTPQLRGGSVAHLEGFCKVATNGNPYLKPHFIGFRLARSSR
jgi:formylglycine-generating enzyme required for sulfatase activity